MALAHVVYFPIEVMITQRRFMGRLGQDTYSKWVSSRFRSFLASIVAVSLVITLFV